MTLEFTTTARGAKDAVEGLVTESKPRAILLAGLAYLDPFDRYGDVEVSVSLSDTPEGFSFSMTPGAQVVDSSPVTPEAMPPQELERNLTQQKEEAERFAALAAEHARNQAAAAPEAVV
jgi:hypothetical protein